MTIAKANDANIREGTNISRLTKRETVSYMHATVTGIRQTAHLYHIGADMSNSIAIDELWNKKPVHNGVERNTMTLRATQKTVGNRGTTIAMS